MTGLIVLGAGRYLGGERIALGDLGHADVVPVAQDWLPTLVRNRNVMATNGFDATQMWRQNVALVAEEITRATGFVRISVNSLERSEEMAVKACRLAGFADGQRPDAIVVCQSQSDSQAHENASVALRLQNEFKVKDFVFGLMDQEAAAGVRAIGLAANLAADGQARELLLCGVQRIVPPFPRVLTRHTVLGDGAAACRLSAAEEMGWCIDFTDTGVLDFLDNPWSVFQADIDLDRLAEALSALVVDRLRHRGLLARDFGLSLRSGLNATVDRALAARLMLSGTTPGFPSDLGYFGSADTPMLLAQLLTTHPAPQPGSTCLLIAAGLCGRVGLVGLTYRQNRPQTQSPSGEAPIYLHGTGYFVPDPPTPVSDWGMRNAVSPDTVAEADGNGVRIFRDSRDAPVYDLVSQAVGNVLRTSGVDPARIDLILVAHTSSFPVIPGPGDIIRRLQVEHGMPSADGFSIGQQNCVSLVSAIRIASLLLRRDPAVTTVLIASGDQIRSEIDVFRLLGTTAIQSDGGSALILSRHPSSARLEAAYNYSDTANWLGRLDTVESNRSFLLFNVRLIRRLLKDAGIAPGELSSCLPPNINRDVWAQVLRSSELSPDLIDQSQFNHVGHVFGNDWIISLTESTAQGPILCLSYGLCDCFGGVVVNRTSQVQKVAGLG